MKPMAATMYIAEPEVLRQARIDLAACFRWFARIDMHESVANHLSFAVSADGRHTACLRLAAEKAQLSDPGPVCQVLQG